jgi:signal transduction histidine kinase
MYVDPSTIQISKKIPQVYIERVTIDDVEADINKQIEVPAGSHRIAFDYLALTLLYPNSATYKYRLNGFDKDWIDAGSTRQAVYTSLPHGEYSFSVMGCNNDGIWNTTGATVSILVKPRIYQTWWFSTLSIFILLGIILMYVRIRTSAIKRKSKYLEELVKERTKLIAEQRDEMVTLNEELRSSQEEVLAQRDALAENIKELGNKNEEIAQMNANLEKIVEQRTKVLEEQNKRISKYSFINAHKLRAPLASILGLINLMAHEAVNETHLTLNKHLLKSAKELDEVVQSIKRMLEGEFKDEDLSREEENQTEPEDQQGERE